jgi:hypothetical protein
MVRLLNRRGGVMVGQPQTLSGEAVGGVVDSDCDS